MKIYYPQEWAQRMAELESCTIITIGPGHDVKRRFLTVHKLYQQAMLQVTLHSPGMNNIMTV